MSLFCPHCQNKIAVLGVRSYFNCPKCHVPLQSNLKCVSAMAIATGVVVEVVTFVALGSALGGFLPALFFWGSIGGIGVFSVYWVAVRQFVELKHAS